MARFATTLLVLAALLFPPAASAGLRTIAPPGDSSVSQYVEVVPTDTGHRPTASLGSQRGALTRSQSQALDNAGANGKTLVAVVDATAPSSAGGGKDQGAPGAGAGGSGGSTLPPGAISGRNARSPLSSVLAAAAGSGGGMGLLLPLIMAAVVIGVLGVLFAKRRSAPPPA